MIVYSKTEAAGTALGICWVQVEWSFSTHITFCTFHIFLLQENPNQEIISSKVPWLQLGHLYKLNTSRRCENMDANKTLRYKIAKLLYHINCLNFYTTHQ